MDNRTVASGHAGDDAVGDHHGRVRRLGDIHELAARQEGLVRRQQLNELGVSRGVLAALVRRGLLHRLTPQVLMVGVAKPTWRQQAIAAVWQAGTGAVLSHGAAARWWKLPGYGEAPVKVTVGPRRARPRTTVGTVVRSCRLLDDEVVKDGLMRVVSVPRVLIDLAPSLNRDQLEELVQAAARGGLLRLPRDLPAFHLDGRHYQAHLAGLLREACHRRELESWLEERFLRLLVANGFPAPITQHRVRVGSQGFRLDFSWPSLGLVVEVDGYATHSTRSQQTADAERRNLLTSTSTGVRLLVFTYDHVVYRPDVVLDQLRTIFSRPVAA